MSAGTLVASIAVVTILYSQIIFMMSFLTEWRQVSVRLDRIEEYLRSEPERGVGLQAGRDDPAGGDIVVDKVQFGFAQDQPLLNDIHFVAEFGKRTAFVGPSGSGKSLTAALLGTIYKPLSGNISFGGRAIEATPLYHLRAEMGYVQQTLFLFQDTIRNNIIYALLKKPGGNGGDIETWIDFSSFDHIRGPEMLEQRLIEAIRGVGLYEDVVHLGLRSRSKWRTAEVTAAEKTEIVKARGELVKEISERYGDCVELYREDRFLEYGTVLENIVFGPTAAVAEAFGSVRRFYKEHLEEILRKQGLADGFLSLGLHIAGANRLLFEKLDQAKSPLLDSLESDREQRERRKKIGDRLDLHADRPMIMKKKDPSLYEEVMETALNHCPGRSKESFLDGKMRENILHLRRHVRKLLGDRVEGSMRFYEEGAFNEFMSFTDNMVFGNIDPTRRKAQEEILDLLRRKLREAGLEGLALKRGLEFDVGERGSRLSGGQRQKVVLARILLRNPSILILDEATASLDAASQARINDLVREQHKEKTVISIVHRLDVIRDYDQILVFDKGRIIERGTFEELIKMGGMFTSLYQGAME